MSHTSSTHTYNIFVSEYFYSFVFIWLKKKKEEARKRVRAQTRTWKKKQHIRVLSHSQVLFIVVPFALSFVLFSFCFAWVGFGIITLLLLFHSFSAVAVFFRVFFCLFRTNSIFNFYPAEQHKVEVTQPASQPARQFSIGVICLVCLLACFLSNQKYALLMRCDTNAHTNKHIQWSKKTKFLLSMIEIPAFDLPGKEKVKQNKDKRKINLIDWCKKINSNRILSYRNGIEKDQFHSVVVVATKTRHENDSWLRPQTKKDNWACMFCVFGV